MLTNYRAALRAPGSVAFSSAAFVMGLPIAIYPLGLILLISTRTGHYSFAGVLSGIYVFANGAGNPVLARLVDRYGQTRVLLPASLVHVAAVTAIVLLAKLPSPDWALIAPTIVCGFAYLSVGSLVRARWSYALSGRPELTTAYSLESTLDEVIFTVGPLIATILATQLDPIAVFVFGAALVVTGAVWLQRQRATDPPAHEVGTPRHGSAMRYRGMPLLVLAAAGMGGVFASAEVTMVAFCGQHGSSGLAGVPLACFAFGSGVSGFVYGSRTRGGKLLDRFRRTSLVFAVLPFAFLAAVNIPTLALLAFVVGLGIAPTLIGAFGLVEQIVPGAALTEGMAWLVTGLSVGYGAAAALVGRLADAQGARFAFTVTIGSGLLGGALALALHAQLRERAVESESAVVG